MTKGNPAPPLKEVWSTFLKVRRQFFTASYEQWLSATADRCQCSVQYVLAAIAVGNVDAMVQLQGDLTAVSRRM